MSNQNKGAIVSILDKEFRVGCPNDQVESLNQAASYLDDQMRLIRRSGRVIGTERIAVMAALNIAHELITLRQGPNDSIEDLNTRIKCLQDKIDQAISKTQTKNYNDSELSGRAQQDETPAQHLMDFGDVQNAIEETEKEHA